MCATRPHRPPPWLDPDPPCRTRVTSGGPTGRSPADSSPIDLIIDLIVLVDPTNHNSTCILIHPFGSLRLNSLCSPRVSPSGSTTALIDEASLEPNFFGINRAPGIAVSPESGHGGPEKEGI